MSIGTKIFSLVSIAFLIALAFGVSAVNLSLAKFVVFISACYLSVISYRTKENLWLTFFVVVVVLFNPLRGLFSFSYAIWRIIDMITAVGFGIFIYRYYDSYRKGDAFESFVSSLFPREAWAIEDWTKDRSHHLRREVESDRHPDLTIRSLNTGKRVAIECKFRSRFWTTKFGTGVFWDKYQHDFYKAYGTRENVQVQVAFGVGGNAKSPAKLFLVPLRMLEGYQGKTVPAQYLQKFEKDTKIPLTLE